VRGVGRAAVGVVGRRSVESGWRHLPTQFVGRDDRYVYSAIGGNIRDAILISCEQRSNGKSVLERT